MNKAGNFLPISTLEKLVRHDHGLEEHKKESLFTMFNTPELFDHLVSGALGAVVSHAVSTYAGLSHPARTLLSLAGFGIGNVLYNMWHENKFTDYNPETGISKIKL
jgi:hypothetical protein